MGSFLLVMATTLLAHVAGLVLFLFGLGVFSQTGYLFLVTLLFGGDASAIAPLLVLTLKVATVSGAALLLHLLRLPDAADADGGISECAALLPPARQPA